jgi:regulatory protein
MRQQFARRKLGTETQLFMSAQRALMRRAHSIHEMKQLLERRAEDKTLVPRVIARLRELNFLDDAKYAMNYASQHAKNRRQGRFRLARELRARGVPDYHIEAAIDATFLETDEATLVRARLNRRLALYRSKGERTGASSELLDRRKIASLYRNLLSAGFSSEIIRAELRRITTANFSEVPEVSEDEA